MKDKTQDSRLKTQDLKSCTLHLASCVLRLSYVLCLLSCVLLASTLYAQEENEEKDRITDLPPVKIEIVDTTQLNIAKEKFRSFTKPDPRVYAPLSPKERLWYLPSTSVPEKFREVPVEAEKDFLFSLAAHSGAPAVLAYQMLLVRGFGSSEALLNMGRWTLKHDRTAERQGNSTVDKLKGAFAYQSENSSLKMDVQYNAKELDYLDKSGEEFKDDRSLADLSVDWNQKLSGNARSSLNISLSSLRMKGPLSSGDENGLDLKTDFGIKVFWPRSNPIDVGLGIGYFDSENDSEEFRKAILRLYLRDNHIRIWSFVLGAGMELMLDARKSLPKDGDYEGGDWKPRVHTNPYFFAVTQIGVRTILRFGVERYVLRQDLKALYLDRDCVRFNPDLNTERTWDLNASLQYRLTRKLTATIGAFDKEIRDLTFFRFFEGISDNDGILSWIPDSGDRRIFGFSSGWELSLMDGKVKQSFEYIHESHDQEIPYRPRDRSSLTITYFAPFGLEPSLSGEFYGARYVDTKGGETLSGYSLWKPRISKAFGKYASVFLAAELYAGRDDYQIWKGYELPTRIVDFGLTLKF